MERDGTAVAGLVRTTRAAQGLAITDAAQKAGVSRSVWHKVESGQTVNEQTLGKIALGLGIDPADVFRAAGYPTALAESTVFSDVASLTERVGTLAARLRVYSEEARETARVTNQALTDALRLLGEIRALLVGQGESDRSPNANN